LAIARRGRSDVPTCTCTPGTRTSAEACRSSAAAIARFVLPWPALLAGLGLGVAEAAFAEVHVGSFEPGVGWSALLPLGLALAVLATRPPDDARDDAE